MKINDRGLRTVGMLCAIVGIGVNLVRDYVADKQLSSEVKSEVKRQLKIELEKNKEGDGA